MPGARAAAAVLGPGPWPGLECDAEDVVDEPPPNSHANQPRLPPPLPVLLLLLVLEAAAAVEVETAGACLRFLLLGAIGRSIHTSSGSIIVDRLSFRCRLVN